MKCPYCNADTFPVSDSYNDGGYRKCDNDHTFHTEDWGDDTELQSTAVPFEGILRYSDVPNDAEIMDVSLHDGDLIIEWFPSDR